MRLIKLILIAGILISLSIPANAATQQSSDFFTAYNLPFYGQWEFSQLRNSSIQESSGNLNYVATMNGSYSNHIVFDIEFLGDCQITGIIQMTDGQNITFSARSYKDWLIQNRVEFSLMGETDVDGFTNIGLGYGNPVIHGDICHNVTDKSAGQCIVFGDPSLWNSYLGVDLLPNNVHGLVYSIPTGIYVHAVYITHISGASYRLKVSEYGPNELSNAVYKSLEGPKGSSYPGIDTILNNLGSITGIIINLFTMVMFIVAFVLWVIYPTHFLLIVVTAESLIVLLSLTSSRNIFQAFSKFASYNEKMFYVAMGMANAIISFFSMIATFVYNLLHALWPLG